MRANKTKAFKKSEAEWYQRLKEAGFEDIEDVSIGDRPLKSWHSFRMGFLPPVIRDSSEIYYEKAEALLKFYEFASEMERMVWELHAKGYSSRAIEKAISVLPGAWKCSWIKLIVAKISREIK